MRTCKGCGVELTDANTYARNRTWKCKPCYRKHNSKRDKAKRAKTAKPHAPCVGHAMIGVHRATRDAVAAMAKERGVTHNTLILDLIAADYNSRQPKPRLGILSRLFSL